MALAALALRPVRERRRKMRPSSTTATFAVRYLTLPEPLPREWHTLLKSEYQNGYIEPRVCRLSASMKVFHKGANVLWGMRLMPFSSILYYIHIHIYIYIYIYIYTHTYL
jgi:hypothetical protein